MGQGNPTVIMDAGGNDFSVTWAAVQSEIAGFTRVCAYDRAGFGWSERSPNPRTSETIVEELHTLLESAEIEGPYVLVGHSFGGMNVRLYAHRYSAQVVETWDIFVGLLKSFFFGGAIGMISCYKGFHCARGASGVARACTVGFVLNFIAILVLDFFLAVLLGAIYESIWGAVTYI